MWGRGVVVIEDELGIRNFDVGGSNSGYNKCVAFLHDIGH
jgi:hypothetical protein